MIKTPVLRLLAVSFLVAALSACGFHLRNSIALPADLGPVRVVSTTPYSPLGDALVKGLQHAGATPAAVDAKDVATLQILSERWGDLPISIDAQGRAQEFSLRYATIFVFRRADGSELVPRQAVELSRDYVSPPQNVTGTTTEREVIADELRREMAASILRRVDGVIQGGAQQDKSATP
ncbi:MAG TPA: LPS assembly lipoprotein LptE [Pseudoxanthomonas sp.]